MVGSIIAILAISLAQYDLVKTQTSLLLFSPEVVDFQLGENKTISYPINSWVSKPYAIHFNIEYLNWRKATDNTSKEIPYRFTVKCYKLEKNEEILFFENIYFIRNNLYKLGNETVTLRENLFDGGNGWDPENPSNSDAWGHSSSLGGFAFNLPYGAYRCDFKDESPPEIKTSLKEAGIVRTAITIGPYKKFIY